MSELSIPIAASRPAERRGLLLIFLAVFALSGRGTFMSSDEGAVFNTATAMTRGSLAIGPGENVFQGPDGRYYARKEILPSVAALPFVVASLPVQMVFGRSPPPLAPGCLEIGVPHLAATNWGVFVTATFCGAWLAALTLVTMYDFALRDGTPRRAALWLTIIAGLATPLWVYAKTVFPQILEAAIVMACFRQALLWRQSGSLTHAWRLGIGCGLGFLTRTAFAPIVMIFAGHLLLAGTATRRTRAVAFVQFCVPVLLSIVATGYVNYLKWGAPWNFGLGSNETFCVNLFVGLYGLLLSPGKGVALFAPVVLVPAFAWRKLYRQGRAEVLLLTAISVAYLLIYARWYDWNGGLCWGPRFLVPLLAPWLALAGRTVRGPDCGVAKVALAITAVFGVAVQWVGVALFPHWINLEEGRDVFSWTTGHWIASIRLFVQRGVDDFWLQAHPRPEPAFSLILLILLALLVAGLVRYATSAPMERTRLT